MSESKELTTAQSKELASLYSDLGIEEMAGMNSEDMTSADDYAMPFLSLLQSGSPQCKKSDARYIKGAEEGVFFNTVSNTLYGEEVTVVPVAYRSAWVEWKLREDGGGYCGEFAPGSQPRIIAQDDKNRDIIDNGHEIKDTRYWYVLIVTDEGFEPAVMGLTRTQLKPSKRLANMTAEDKWPDGVKRGKAPPFFVWSYNAKSVPQQSDEYAFVNWEFSRGAPVTDRNLLEAAKALREAVKAGQVREATESLDEETAASDEGTSY
jgi:hypothetical protein